VKRKFLLSFGGVGLFVAVLLAGTRLYMLGHEPQFRGAMYGGWFDILTLVLWPGAFYLTVLQSDEPAKVQFVVWSIAVLVNPAIYAFVGWLAWWILKPVRSREGSNSR
jgi:hypothetical protein